MRDLSAYAFINARVRGMYSRFLSSDQWERLIQARDLADAAAVLHGTDYASFIREDVMRDEGLESVERDLLRHDIAIHQKILGDIPRESRVRNVVERLREFYEVNEVKALLRCWNDRDQDGGRQNILMEAFVHPLDIGRVMDARDSGELADAFQGTPYRRAFLAAGEKFRATGALFYIEAALDHDHFIRLWRDIDRLPGADRTVASRLTGIEVDIENIGWLVRLRQYYDFPPEDLSMIMLPRGRRIDERTMRQSFLEEGLAGLVRALGVRPYQDIAVLFSKEMDRSRLSLLEGVLYQFLFTEARRAMGGFPFTIGTILAYLVLKRAETRKIISILYGKDYGLVPDRIKGALLC